MISCIFTKKQTIWMMVFRAKISKFCSFLKFLKFSSSVLPLRGFFKTKKCAQAETLEEIL